MATFGPCFCKRGREGERKRGGEGGGRKRGRERRELMRREQSHSHAPPLGHEVWEKDSKHI